MDLDALHAFLWRKRGTRGIVPFTQLELADLLGISLAHTNITLRRMVNEQRLKLVRHKYYVTDPMLARWSMAVPTKVENDDGSVRVNEVRRGRPLPTDVGRIIVGRH